MSENGGDRGKSVSLQFALALLSLTGVLGAAFLSLIGVLGAAFIENWEPFPFANSTSVSVETEKVSDSLVLPPVDEPEPSSSTKSELSPNDSFSDLSESEDIVKESVRAAVKIDDEDAQEDALPTDNLPPRGRDDVFALPMQDSDGYYLSWRDWDTWRSVPLQLNCRQTPTEKGVVVHRFVANELMNADTATGSPMVRDSEAKPWLKVKAKNGGCFVRARSRYIVPLSIDEQVNAYILNDSALPMQDSDGYYLSWRDWDTWRSVPLQLNCRQTPTERGTVVHRFVANELMNADTATGSPMVRDSETKPWLKVKAKNGDCFVRARSRYIVPSVQR